MGLVIMKEPSSHQKEIMEILWTYVKILVLIGVNVVAFLPLQHYYLWIIIGIELLLALILRINFTKFLPLIKFLLMNLIPIYLLLYFVDMNWLSALVYLSVIISKIWLLLLSILIFGSITSLNSLVNALATPKIRIRTRKRRIVIGIPKRFSVVFITVLLFIPTISSQIRKVVFQQKARGYKVRIFRLKPILVPAILYLLDLSMKLSLSMESRGFDI